MKFISKLFLASAVAATFFCSTSKAADFGLMQRKEKVESLKEVGQEMVKEAVNLGIISFIITNFNKQVSNKFDKLYSFNELPSKLTGNTKSKMIPLIQSSALLAYYIYRNYAILKKYISSKRG